MQRVLLIVMVTFIVVAYQTSPRKEPAGPAYSVEGIWDWTRDGEICVSTWHVIEYSADRQKLKFKNSEPVPQPSGSESTTYAYQILAHEKNAYHLAMENEYRRDAKGNLVTWYLILGSADSYQWRRSDWEASQLTQPIMRCAQGKPGDPFVTYRAVVGHPIHGDMNEEGASFVSDQLACEVKVFDTAVEVPELGSISDRKGLSLVLQQYSEPIVQKLRNDYTQYDFPKLTELRTQGDDAIKELRKHNKIIYERFNSMAHPPYIQEIKTKLASFNNCLYQQKGWKILGIEWIDTRTQQVISTHYR